MTSLAERVLATIRRRRLFPPGSRVLAAVSGGPDSVALVHVLAELAAHDVLALAGLVHLDHRLRGDESDRDAAFCERLARDLGLASFVGAEDVTEIRRTRGGSLEAVARDVRYAYFERVRAREAADVVAVGHTRDDQAETVLLRLLRGAGLRGTTGILPRRGTVVRPLIDVSRREVLDYLATRRLQYVVDATNQDLTRSRNRIRHAILPELTRHFGPSVPAVLARHADAARDDEILLTALADAAAGRVVRQARGATGLIVAELDRQPAAIARRLVRAALEASGAAPSLAHVEAVLALAGSGRAGALDLPACQAELCADEGVLLIRRRGAERPEAAVPWRHDLPVPGQVELPEAGLRCRAERRAARPVEAAGEAFPEGWSAVVAGGTLGERLVVRAWRPGDRLQPLGLNGRKKVQDLFVDRKVPRARRRQVPIVTDESDRIIWVAGHALAEPFRVTPATKSVVVLSFEPLGGPE